jgi:hypothetical protein
VAVNSCRAPANFGCACWQLSKVKFGSALACIYPAPGEANVHQGAAILTAGKQHDPIGFLHVDASKVLQDAPFAVRAGQVRCCWPNINPWRKPVQAFKRCWIKHALLARKILGVWHKALPAVSSTSRATVNL